MDSKPFDIVDPSGTVPALHPVLPDHLPAEFGVQGKDEDLTLGVHALLRRTFGTDEAFRLSAP